MQKIEFYAMGCEMAVFLDNDDPTAALALQKAPGWFETWEQSLSRFRPDSELNRLNASAGLGFEVSPILSSALSAALEAAIYSDSLVVPNLLQSLERAGYDRSFIHFAPTFEPGTFMMDQAEELSFPQDSSNLWRAIQLDTQRSIAFLPIGMKLELGGTAKGWAASQAMQQLRDLGPVLVNAGGDIAVSGPLVSGSPWPVGVDDPLKAQDELALLAIESCGVATSGIDYRRWIKDGRWKHHLIDPRTGSPAVTDLLSTTIIAPDVFQAETAAKVVMILGSSAGQRWLEEHPSLSGLLVRQDGRLLRAGQLDHYLWSER